jgi:hypothetical protein
MTQDGSASDPELSDRLTRMEQHLEEVNTRIARLAIALGISLEDDSQAQLASQTPAVPIASPDRRGSDANATAGREHRGPDRRMNCKREELRGLLIMRYGLQQRYVETVGVQATRQIMVTAEAHLERDGFRPGADGINVKRIFDGS